MGPDALPHLAGSPGAVAEGAPLLAITPRAWHAIDDLASEHDATGIRVTRSDCGSLEIDIAAGPEQDDTVVWSLGTVVFVDRQAAPAVDHAVLDLRATPDSRSFFFR